MLLMVGIVIMDVVDGGGGGGCHVDCRGWVSLCLLLYCGLG